MTEGEYHQLLSPEIREKLKAQALRIRTETERRATEKRGKPDSSATQVADEALEEKRRNDLAHLVPPDHVAEEIRDLWICARIQRLGYDPRVELPPHGQPFRLGER
jgi:hypothetical protein